MYSSRFYHSGVCCWVGVLAIALLFIAGCRDNPSQQTPTGSTGALRSTVVDNQMFHRAADQLNSLEDSSKPIEAMGQVVTRFDQWIKRQSPNPNWETTPEIEQLQAPVNETAQLAKLTAEQLEAIRTSEDASGTLKATQAASGTLLQLAQSYATLAQSTQVMHLMVMAQDMALLGQTLEKHARELEATPAQADTIAESIRQQMEQIRGVTQGISNLAQRFEIFSQQLDLARFDFAPSDSDPLRQAVWLRNIQRWASGDQPGDIHWANALFQWTIRNVELRSEMLFDPQSGQAVPGPAQTPKQTLLIGRGTQSDRAWIFISLLRQMKIEACLLGIQNPDQPESVVPWAVGVLIEGKIYLYDMSAGVPIPAPGDNAMRLKSGGGLEIMPATLQQAKDDPSVLARMQAPMEELEYPITSENLKRVTAILVYSPSELSQRMAILQSNLSSQNRMVLSGSYQRSAALFEQVGSIDGAQLWRHPIRTQLETLLSPSQMAAELDPYRYAWVLSAEIWNVKRVEQEGDGTDFGTLPHDEDGNILFDEVETVRELRQQGDLSDATQAPLARAKSLYFGGKFFGQPSAASYFQQARISDRDLMSNKVPANARPTLQRIKLTASYWMGIMSAEQGKYSSAIDYLETRTLDYEPNSTFTSGAYFNLGQIYELQGDYDQSIQWYERAAREINGYGCMLRADWIKQLQSGAAVKSGTPDVVAPVPTINSIRPPQ